LRTAVILYLDTSSLLKLFFREEGTSAVKALTQQARTIACSMIGYVEARSAFVRAVRGGRLTLAEHTLIIEAFERGWATYFVREVNESLVREAAALAEKHYLRSLDAFHLASALTLQRQLGEDLTFSAADGRLMSAASVEGLLVPS
jgi:predicted nucleic acid-binding protein